MQQPLQKETNFKNNKNQLKFIKSLCAQICNNTIFIFICMHELPLSKNEITKSALKMKWGNSLDIRSINSAEIQT